MICDNKIDVITEKSLLKLNELLKLDITKTVLQYPYLNVNKFEAILKTIYKGKTFFSTIGD